MKTNQLRIIAGQWRGRKITFPDVVNLRPTPDRIRETLFNWLKATIVGARCLDLFAGSGALSFEALSRGASVCLALEQDSTACVSLHSNAHKLGADNLEIIQTDCLTWLQQPYTFKKDFQNMQTPPVQTPIFNSDHPNFNIIFVDPPYAEKWLSKTFSFIDQGHWLSEQGLIYFESDTAISPDNLPATWQIIREKKAGKIYYYLAQNRAGFR